MKKINNKGFSLVELIIVIAIMAILIGVLAPQYIKYVEKSRVSADEDVADSLKNAMMTATTDEEYVYSLKAEKVIEFKYANAGTAGVSVAAQDATCKAAVENALKEYFAKYESARVKSKKYKPCTYTVSLYESTSASGEPILKVDADWGSGSSGS